MAKVQKWWGINNPLYLLSWGLMANKHKERKRVSCPRVRSRLFVNINEGRR